MLPTLNQTTTEVLYGANLFSTSYQLLTSITSLQQSTLPTSNMISLNITIKSLKITGFNVTFSSPLILSTTMLKLSYLTVDLLIRNLQFYIFDTYIGDNQPGIMPSISTSEYLFNFTTRIQRSLIIGTSQYIVQPFIKGYEIVNNISPEFSIEISAGIYNSTFYLLRVSSNALSQQYISKVYVGLLFFNMTLLQSQNTFYEQFDFQFKPLSPQYSSFGMYQINVQNYFIGVREFTFTPLIAGTLHYDIYNDFTNQKSLLQSISLQLRTLSVLIIKVQRRTCTNLVYPYFMNSNYRCYNICPVRLWQDNTLIKCQSCSFDCYQCTNGTSCTKCNSTYFFRQDNVVNGVLRCKPLVGYYNSRYNDAVALKCDLLKCVQCLLNNDNCTKCLVGQYLQKTNYTGQCVTCMANCLQCVDGVTCGLCQPLYYFDSVTTNQCRPVCSSNCTQCHIQTTPIYESICDTCLIGYIISQSSLSQCYNACGDGILIPGVQQCDDNNSINNDGCSQLCKLQLGYGCYLINNNYLLPQVCYYQQEVKFVLNKLIKVPYKNVIRFDLVIQTINGNILRQLIYDRIISVDMQYKEFVIVSQDIVNSNISQVVSVVVTFQVEYTESIKGAVEVTLDPKLMYSNSTLQVNHNNNLIVSRLLIDDKQQQQLNNNNQQILSSDNHLSQTQQEEDNSQQTIQSHITKTVSTPISTPISTSSTSSIKFITTPLTKHSLSLVKSDNNIAIIYQPSHVLLISQITSYLFLTVSLLALLIFLCSLSVYGGKIITLQYIFVCNCAYFSLITLAGDNIQTVSTFYAMANLRFITLNVFPITFNSINTNSLWWTGISNSFLINCLIPIVILLLPIIIFVISFVLYKKTTTSLLTLKKSQFLYKYSLGQLLYTSYLFSAYAFTAGLTFIVMKIINKSSNIDITGFVVGSIILIIGVILFILLIKRRQLFWQFISTFYKTSIPEYYMNFTTLIIWVNSISLVVMTNLVYANIIPISMSLIWIGFLLRYKPYRDGSQRRRPIVIQVVNIIVNGIFLVLKIKVNQYKGVYKMSIVYHYLPLCIGIILLLAFIYTCYCLFHKVKQAYSDRQQYLQNENLVNCPATNKRLNNITNKGLIHLPIQTQNQKSLSVTNSDSLSIQHNNNKQITIQRQIISQLKKQKGLNFLSLALSIDKKQLDQNWQMLQKIDVRQQNKLNSSRLKDIKRQLDRSFKLSKNSPFVEENKLKDYFRLKVEDYGMCDCGSRQSNDHGRRQSNDGGRRQSNDQRLVGTPQRDNVVVGCQYQNDRKNINIVDINGDTLLLSHTRDEPLRQSQQQSQVVEYNINRQSYSNSNCEWKQSHFIQVKYSHKLQLLAPTYNINSQLLSDDNNHNKLKQQWENFFQPKSPIISRRKIHSLMEYDMI